MKIVILAATLALSVNALAQDHSGHTMAPKGTSAFSKDMEKSMADMHKNMLVKPSGDVDKDFVLMMIPHHQGAIDMAKGVLKHGKDPKVKKIAQEIIAAQEKEITEFNKWLKEKK